MAAEKDLMLKGLKVIDLTNNLAGPCTAMLMAERGAEVFHIERPGRGDDSRKLIPVVDGLGGTMFMWANHDKKSVALDLKDKRAVELLYRMAKDADVLIESYRPGVLDKLGLGYDKIKEINPKIIYCSVSAFGHRGPNSSKPGYDIIAQAYSGIIQRTGEPDGDPVKIGPPIGDYVGALNAYGSVMTALFYRSLTGKGQYIDVALARGLYWMNNAFNYPTLGEKNLRTGSFAPDIAPYGIFRGKNGGMIIAAGNQNLWEKLANLMGAPELITCPDFADMQSRVENKLKLRDVIEAWLHTFEDVNEACGLIDKAGIPASPICDSTYMYKDPHAVECGWVKDIGVSKGMTSIKDFPGPIGLSDYSESADPIVAPAPALGEHNYEVMKRYGMTDEEIEACLKDWNS
ncbi:MAG: CoA transferase [Lachnospiraceae bacterium]|nr:CoA transferase [Lachnospiraceae bacterium]